MSYSVNFDAPNGSPWPGYAFPALLNGTGGFADIQNNEGRFRFNNSGGYSNRVKIQRSMTAELDGTVLASFRVPASRPDIAVEFSIRGSGIQPTYQGPPATSYTFTVRPAANIIHMWRQQNEGPLIDIGQSSTYTMSGGDEIHVRMNVLGATVRGKIWKNGETEPSAWLWSYTDPTPLPSGTDHISMRGATGYDSGDVFFLQHVRVSSTSVSTPTPAFRRLGAVTMPAGQTLTAVPFAAPQMGSLLISVLGVDKTAGGISGMRATPGWRVLGGFDSTDVSGAVALRAGRGNETTMTWEKINTTMTTGVVYEVSNLRYSVLDAVAFTPQVDALANLTAENAAGAAPADGIAIAYHSVDTTTDGTISAAWPDGFPTFTNGYVLQDKYPGTVAGAAGVAIASKPVRAGDSLATSVAINSADQAFVGVIFIPYVRSRTIRSWKSPGATTSLGDNTQNVLRPPLSTTPVVVNVNATGLTSRIALSWEPLSTSVLPTSYLIGRNGTDANGVGAMTTTIPGTARSFSFDNLVNGSTYTVFVEPINGTIRGTRVSKTATPATQVTGRDAPAQPSIVGTLPPHMVGTWNVIFEDDFDDPALTAQKWNLNRDAYHTTNGWWTQDQAGMQVPPQPDALEIVDSAVWLKVTRKTNPTGRPFVNAIMTTARPKADYGTPCKFAIPKNSTTFTEGLLWNGTARGTLSGFWLLGNTYAGDPFDVNGNPTKGFSSTGSAVWEQTTAGWPTGGEVDILEFPENNTSERHRPYSSLHWSKDHLTYPPGTWGSREFIGHPDSATQQRPELQNSWHKWGLYRSPTLMVIYIDGVELCRWVKGSTYTTWDGPHTPAPVEWTGDMYLFLSYSIGGAWGGQGWTTEQLEEGRFGVRYVKVWQMPTETTSTPSAPTNLTHTLGTLTTTGYSATITWQQPTSTGSSPISGYTVARDGTDTSGSGPWSTTLSDPLVGSFTFTRLAPGSTYNFTVRAINGAGPGGTATTTAAIPGSNLLLDEQFSVDRTVTAGSMTDVNWHVESGSDSLVVSTGTGKETAPAGGFGRIMSMKRYGGQSQSIEVSFRVRATRIGTSTVNAKGNAIGWKFPAAATVLGYDDDDPRSVYGRNDTVDDPGYIFTRHGVTESGIVEVVTENFGTDGTNRASTRTSYTAKTPTEWRDVAVRTDWPTVSDGTGSFRVRITVDGTQIRDITIAAGDSRFSNPGFIWLRQDDADIEWDSLVVRKI